MSSNEESSACITPKEPVSSAADEERMKPTSPKFPPSVFFIIGNEFCERFSYYGMRTVLTLYFIQVLSLTEDEAVTAFHSWTMACYFTPIFGAILADSILGRYSTILYISILYAIGSVVLSVASWLEKSWVTVLGLVMIAIGTGGIKPCVSAFGGDQFGPGSEKQLAWFFSLFYLSINAGSLISTFVTPVFRQEVTCSARGDCFPLAFGVPAVLMICALALFWLGRNRYTFIPPAKGNIILETTKCIVFAAWAKIRNTFSRGGIKKNHWIDFAEGKFDAKLINDVKSVTGILCLFLPIPIFWALFDQQGSRWTLQANKMDGQLFGSWYIQPDQIQVINPVLIVLMIPLFESVIYPIFSKLNILQKPLQKMTVGGVLAAVSFVVAAIIHQMIESSEPIVPTNDQFSITIINGNNRCNLSHRVTIDFDNLTQMTKSLPNFLQVSHVTVDGNFNINNSNNKSNSGQVTLKTTGGQVGGYDCYFIETNFTYHRGQSMLLYLDTRGHLIQVLPEQFKYSRPEGRESSVLAILDIGNCATGQINTCNSNQNDLSASTGGHGGDGQKYLQLNSDRHSYNLSIFNASPESNVPIGHQSDGKSIIQLESPRGSFKVAMNEVNLPSGQLSFDPGSLNAFVIDCCKVLKVEIIAGYKISMFLQVIQYIIITAGEIMFSITGLEFSYSQAPKSMRSAITAAWLLTTAFGNLIVMVIAHSHLFAQQSYEFYFFASLMLVDMAIFAFIAYNYKPRVDVSLSSNLVDEITLSNKNLSNGQAG